MLTTVGRPSCFFVFGLSQVRLWNYLPHTSMNCWYLKRPGRRQQQGNPVRWSSILWDISSFQTQRQHKPVFPSVLIRGSRQRLCVSSGSTRSSRPLLVLSSWLQSTESFPRNSTDSMFAVLADGTGCPQDRGVWHSSSSINWAKRIYTLKI